MEHLPTALAAIVLFVIVVGVGEFLAKLDDFRDQFSPAAQRQREAEFLSGLLGEAGQGGAQPHGDRFTRAGGVAPPSVVGPHGAVTSDLSPSPADPDWFIDTWPPVDYGPWWDSEGAHASERA